MNLIYGQGLSIMSNTENKIYNFLVRLYFFFHRNLLDKKTCPSSIFCYGFFAVRNKTGNFLLRNIGLRDHHITGKAQLKCASSTFGTDCNLSQSQLFFKEGLLLGKHLILESEYEPNFVQRLVDNFLKMCYSIV